MKNSDLKIWGAGLGLVGSFCAGLLLRTVNSHPSQDYVQVDVAIEPDASFIKCNLGIDAFRTVLLHTVNKNIVEVLLQDLYQKNLEKTSIVEIKDFFNKAVSAADRPQVIEKLLSMCRQADQKALLILIYGACDYLPNTLVERLMHVNNLQRAIRNIRFSQGDYDSVDPMCYLSFIYAVVDISRDDPKLLHDSELLSMLGETYDSLRDLAIETYSFCRTHSRCVMEAFFALCGTFEISSCE